LTEIWDYIRSTRKKIIRDTIGLQSDHGVVFVSERTGMPLRPNTVTQEIHALARHAGLVGRAAPHMFRHRFVTKIFVALILQYDLKTPDDLRKALLSLKDAKQQLMEWTGHRSMKSLDHYIDFAFAEVEQLEHSMDPIKASAELDALRHSIDVYASELDAAGSAVVAKRLHELLHRSRQ